MGKIVSMEEFRQRNADDEDYTKVLQSVCQALGQAADATACGALNLACNGVWRAWSDAQPIGAMVNFEDRDLANCGDSRVDRAYP